ncbi:MAG: YceI family protein [Deltaproteobacteria bacterium]|nr:YceI family protein [Deltaproteobacteria bacterium]
MKTLLSLLALVPTLALSAPATAWKLDPSHSTVGFSVKHLVISQARGEFSRYTGTVTLDEADVSRSRVEASIEAASVDTRNADRDGHLRSPDFFDVAKYPTITFASTQVEKRGADRLAVTGNLTLHGVTRPVTLDVSLTPEVKGLYGETRRGFTATGKISRKDFGLTWNKLIEAGPALGDEVTLSFELEAVKEQPKAASR